jgi:hypothetical protein
MAVLFQGGRATLLEDVEVDARFSEVHTFTGQVSKFAREDGAIAADHIQLDPAVLDIVASVGNASREATTSRGERAKTALDALQQLRSDRGLYDIVTEHKLYTNMAFLGLSWGNEAPLSGRAEIRAHFEEFPVAVLSTFAPTEDKLPSDGTSKTASGETNGGRQDAVTEESAPKRSLAAQILNRSSDKYGASNTD